MVKLKGKGKKQGMPQIALLRILSFNISKKLVQQTLSHKDI